MRLPGQQRRRLRTPFCALPSMLAPAKNRVLSRGIPNSTKRGSSRVLLRGSGAWGCLAGVHLS
uniref:Uncharacterized protein n=1 Tax=Hyaloperonospora arabidopsidis (strain Emoy2) TaxID=559515 RepID=M4BVQ4_HYAAE